MNTIPKLILRKPDLTIAHLRKHNKRLIAVQRGTDTHVDEIDSFSEDIHLGIVILYLEGTLQNMAAKHTCDYIRKSIDSIEKKGQRARSHAIIEGMALDFENIARKSQQHEWGDDFTGA
jgi:Na+/H+-translocating membrane pyrophosphatase